MNVCAMVREDYQIIVVIALHHIKVYILVIGKVESNLNFLIVDHKLGFHQFESKGILLLIVRI